MTQLTLEQEKREREECNKQFEIGRHGGDDPILNSYQGGVMTGWLARASHGWKKFDAGDVRTYPTRSGTYPVILKPNEVSSIEPYQGYVLWTGVSWATHSHHTVIAFYELPEYK